MMDTLKSLVEKVNAMHAGPIPPTIATDDQFREVYEQGYRHALIDVLAHLGVAEAERSSGAEWLPIASAPKDGTPVLVCVRGYGSSDEFGWKGRAPFTAYFGNYHPNAPGKGEWRDDSGHRRPHITHWMPLPTPPQSPPLAGSDYKTLYYELLYEVVKKHPGESRHETARRYIRERETPSSDQCCAKANPPTGKD